MELKSHWGQLLVRWLCAIGIAALGIGLGWAFQYFWHMDWYIVAAMVGGIVLLGMAYNTANTLRVRVHHNATEDGLEIVDGVLCARVHPFLYSRMISYSIKPSTILDKLGCTVVVLQAYVGAQDKVEYAVCLSKADADILLADLEQHLVRG